MLPASAATCAPAWQPAAVYTGGATVSYNGHNWTAKWWTQNEAPGTAGVWPTRAPAAAAAAAQTGRRRCSYPNWVAGRNYVTGDIVRYTDGLYYLAEHDNPGYDPIDQHLVLGALHLRRRQGGTHRRPAASSSARRSSTRCSRAGTRFYTYSGLTAALSAYPGFANTGSDTVKKQEAAAFLANVSHETGGLVYIVEQNTANYPHYCDSSQPYGCPAGQAAYYGRGPIQLSWNFNYKAAGDALGIDLLGQPEPGAERRGGLLEDRPLVLEHPDRPGHDDPAQRDGQRRRLRRDDPQHQRQPRVQRRNPAQVQSRVAAYQRFVGILGVGVGAGSLSC